MNHQFQDPGLLDVALTHTSWTHDHGGEHNERMEFLGDAVLQLCSSEILYEEFPEAREGVLHVYRTQLVSTGHLAGIARRWGLQDKVKLGKGGPPAPHKDRLLAGLFEAVLGAVYLDGGYPAATKLVRAALADDVVRLGRSHDPRILLHEWAQRNEGCPPDYVVISEEGPPHDRLFTIEIRTQAGAVGTGQGKSKKAASIEAAAVAIETLGIKP